MDSKDDNEKQKEEKQEQEKEINDVSWKTDGR